MTDLDLAAVNRRERALERRVSLLTAVVLVLAVVVGALVGYVRSIEAGGRQNNCLASIQVRLLTSTLGGGLSEPSEELVALFARLTAAAADADRALLAGADPCSITIPPIITTED